MRVEMIRFATGGFDEGFDLRAPFRFDFKHIEPGDVGDERIVFEVIPVCIYDGRNRFARQERFAHCQNKVDSQPKLGCFLHRNSNIMDSCGNVHHAGGGCHHAIKMCFTDAA